MPAESVETLCQRARQAIAQGSHGDARQLYLQALGIKADSPDVHYGLATVCFLGNDLPNAAYHFKEVTRLDPLRAGAHINLGAVYNRLDQIEEAIQVLRRGIQLDSHRAEGFYNLGLAFRKKKQLDLAIQAYREAVRLNPRMQDAFLNLANAYLDKQQYGPAIAHYEKALEIRPNWDKAEHGLRQAQAGMNSAKSPDAVPSNSDKETALMTGGNTAVSDPNQQVEPELQLNELTMMHRATIEGDNHGRAVLTILESQIEPAIKELSSVLLYPSKTRDELDRSIQKLDGALEAIRNAHHGLSSSIDHIQKTTHKLFRR